MKYSYKVGCSTENLRGIRDFIRGSLKNHGVSDLDVSEMVLAMDEMCSNLIIHAHHCNSDELFELHIIAEPTKPIVFEIIDDGTVFDINQFHEPDLGNIIHQKRKGGLGIRLVKSIMDKVEYEQAAGMTICRLTKNVHYS
jgi:serine/threonine-protein kinase RsbW